MIGKWDSYVLNTCLYDKNQSKVLFLKGNQNGKMYYSLIHLLDLAVLDTRYIGLNPFKLSAALIYSILLFHLESRKPNFLVNFLNNEIANHDMDTFLRLFLDFLGRNYMIKFSNLFKSFNYIGCFVHLFLSSNGKIYQCNNFSDSKLLQTPYLGKEKIHSYFETLDYKK